jgi:hypothetical protein
LVSLDITQVGRTPTYVISTQNNRWAGPLNMPSQNEHGKLIAAAAKKALLPLGCVRKGQSRVWYSDQRFWAIWIEFQPSGWSKGSYLNVGTSCFWHAGAGFLPMYRPTDFISFENVEQFTPLIENMAAVAAREVLTMRKRFGTLDDIQRHLLSHPLRDGWPVQNAAIASWLLGDIGLSRSLFQRMADWPTYGYDWQFELKRTSAGLAAKLNGSADMLATLLETIQHQRSLIRLPPDIHCLDDLPAARSAQGLEGS